MRRLLSFACDGATLAGSLDLAEGNVGVLVVTGGSQTRIGSHRMFERLAASLAEAGYPTFRFDRRGVGDSSGEDPGFRGNGADIAAAAAAFRDACPRLSRITGFGLCDGATSLALFGSRAGCDALLLVNPWFVEAEAGAPASAAVRHHYRQRLLSIDGWKRLLTGAISYRKLLAGLAKVAKGSGPSSLADEAAAALDQSTLPVTLILARHDNTAVAAEDAWNGKAFVSARKRARIVHIDSDSHTFARPGDDIALRDAVLAALAASGGD